MNATLSNSLLAACLALPALAQDWPHWRGPRYDGSAIAADLPTDFGKEKRVRWATKMPGPAACTPIVVGERVFLTAVDEARDGLVVLCVDRKSGALRWQHDVDSEYSKGAGTGRAGGERSNYASPSPTTDGERVVFFFGNGELVAHDYEGKKLWQRNVQQDYGDFAFQWTFSASPTMWEGKLFLPVLQRDQPTSRGRRGGGRRGAAEDAAAEAPIESFVLAMEPATGKTIYKHVRPSPARMESLESYTTMIPFVGDGGRKELLLAGGDVITGHDPATGKELWRWGTWNEGHREEWWRLVPSVVAGDGVALACAPKRAPVYAVPLGGEGELDADEGLLWQSEGRPNPVSSDVPTPAYDEGHFYVLSDVRSALSKVKAKDGEVVWTTAMPHEHLWRASPTVADGKVWCINHAGLVVIVDQQSGEIVARIAMGEEDDDAIRSTIVVAHGDLFIRTNTTLFCIGGE
jgi:outer membrane protein assembly factor BamB